MPAVWDVASDQVACSCSLIYIWNDFLPIIWDVVLQILQVRLRPFNAITCHQHCHHQNLVQKVLIYFYHLDGNHLISKFIISLLIV